jgi:hypothetical protein
MVATSTMLAAQAWDLLGGGFPNQPLLVEMRAMAAGLLRLG